MLLYNNEIYESKKELKQKNSLNTHRYNALRKANIIQSIDNTDNNNSNSQHAYENSTKNTAI